ncbi:MAG TPA: alpha/beta hydrolase [Solirubrobacteraceae bacterium]|nr:alpha/beta hydrolase [Solirubrobacteraceae bacterium]
MRIEGIEVPVPDGRIAAWRLGDAANGAPEVVAIHGITATSRSWLAVAEALGSRAALITPDLRGRGASAPVGPPFGIDGHVRDVLALLDELGLARPVIAGHSLGAYIACRFAVRYPDRVRSLVLVDGGLPIPGLPPGADPATLLGPVVRRLREEFADRGAYRAWWAAHPAFGDGDVDPRILDAYADYDLCGEPPRMRSSVRPEVVPVDGDDVMRARDAAELGCDAVALHAPRGLNGEPPPMQPEEIVATWVAQAPGRRRAVAVPDTNHYTIAMGRRGAAVVADEIASATLRADAMSG